MFNLLIRYRHVLLIFLIGITAFSFYKSTKIEVNTDVSQFFPKDDNDYKFYKKIKKEFKDDDQFLLIGIRNKSDELNDVFYKRVLQFSDSIINMSNIVEVTGLHNLEFPVKSLFRIVGVPYMKLEDSINLNFNRNKVYEDYEVTQSFINKEGNVLFLWCEIETDLNTIENELLFRNIDEIKSNFDDLEIFIWGRKHIELSFKEILIDEIKEYGLWMSFFLCITLLMIFRKPLALIFPVLVLFSVVTLFLGGMVLLNKPLGTMSNLFPVVILIVGISDVIHFCIKYSIENKKGNTTINSTRITINEIGWTTFITSYTTALGFFILCISPMNAMINFGLESGIIVLITYIVTLFLIPIFFIGKDRNKLFSLSKGFELFFNDFHHRIRKILRHPNKILISYGLLLVVSIGGILMINTNSNQYSIPNKSKLWTDYKFFEKNYGGSRNFELVIEAQNDLTFQDPELFKVAFEIHNYLSSSQQLSSLKSPILYYNSLHKANQPSNYENMPYSNDRKSIIKYGKQLGSLTKTNHLMNPEKTIFRYIAQMEDIGRNKVMKTVNEIDYEVSRRFNDPRIKIRVSGIDYILDIAHKRSINSMLMGLLIVILIVGATLGLIFRNVILMILALILNLVPLIITAGILGFTKLELRGETALIFIVGFVIAIDDTIHLLSKFQWERKKGLDVETAIDVALKECGKAILATSLILIGGFLILLKSNSLEIFTLGLLASIILIVALSVDLILAPTIIRKWFKKYL